MATELFATQRKQAVDRYAAEVLDNFDLRRPECFEQAMAASPEDKRFLAKVSIENNKRWAYAKRI
jgi:hypothetical protein